MPGLNVAIHFWVIFLAIVFVTRGKCLGLLRWLCDLGARPMTSDTNDVFATGQTHI